MSRKTIQNIGGIGFLMVFIACGLFVVVMVPMMVVSVLFELREAENRLHWIHAGVKWVGLVVTILVAWGGFIGVTCKALDATFDK